MCMIMALAASMLEDRMSVRRLEENVIQQGVTSCNCYTRPGFFLKQKDVKFMFACAVRQAVFITIVITHKSIKK